MARHCHPAVLERGRKRESILPREISDDETIAPSPKTASVSATDSKTAVVNMPLLATSPQPEAPSHQPRPMSFLSAPKEEQEI